MNNTTAPQRILELCKEETTNILGQDRPTSLQEEQLTSPILKYLLAFSNQPDMCTETQICQKLSIPRSMARKVIQGLEAYEVIQPLADFGTVKPYKVSRIETAIKSAWISLTPGEVKILFGVRSSKDFDGGGKRFQTYVTAKDGTRWLPPIDAAQSFFSAITSDSKLRPPPTDLDTAFQVDLIFLGRLLRETTSWPLTGDDLLLIKDKNEITEEDHKQARKELVEKYCHIFCTITDNMLSRGTSPRIEHLAYMTEVLRSCINVARTFGANEDRIDRCEELIEKMKPALNTTTQ